MTRFAPLALLAALSLAGCSGSGGLTTGSLFGGSSKPAEAAAAPTTSNDPTTRAFQVGSVSARAVKCGYNFDPTKLRASFLAAEIGAGASTDEMPRVEKIYDVAYNGVIKGVANQSDYCTPTRTAEIKEDLTRHLAGDFSPRPRKVVAQDSGGLFSGWGDTSSSDNGPKFGSGDWWSKQDSSMGN